MKYLEDNCLDKTHKIKSVIYAILNFHTFQVYSNILCFTVKLLKFCSFLTFCYVFFHVLLYFFFCCFVFYSKMDL